MNEKDLTKLAERFCAAPLPNSVCADLCATTFGQADRRGTNLLSVVEAREVLRHVLSPMGEPVSPPREFKNESGLKFTDISSEAERVYNFGSKGFVKITAPLRLNVSDSGGHRIFTEDGKSHYIPSGWIELSWSVRADSPNFVK